MKATAEHSTHSASRAQRSSDNASPFFSPKRAENTEAVATAEPFFQPKLKVGAPNDKYEQEADAVADQVVQRMAEEKAGPQVQGKVGESSEPTVQRTVVTPTLTPIPISRIQRSAEPEAEEQVELEGEEVALQRKPIFDSDGDGDPSIQRKCAACEANEEEGHVHRFPAAAISGGVQRKCAACEAEENIQPKAMPALQRSGDGGFTASSDFSSQLASSRGGGSPLPAETRASMEDGIGADFSGVRVHTGSKAAGLSSQIGAQAFTHGSDVYFNEGKYDPGSEAGDRLLAHELTHTVQQGGTVSRKPQTTTNEVQRSWLGDAWGFVTDTAKAAADMAGSAVKSGISWLLQTTVPGFTLLNVVMGKDLVTGEPVARTGVNIIQAYMDLTPVFGAILFNELKETESLTKAGKWVEAAILEIGVDFDDVAKRLAGFWEAMQITKGIDYNVLLYRRIMGPVMGKLRAFDAVVTEKVKALRLEGALLLVGANELLTELKKNPKAFKRVVDEPKLILKYFMEALSQGFTNFKENFGKHFKNALLDWLFGKAAEMGITMPAQFNLAGLFSFIAQLLGVTYAYVRKQVVKQLGDKGEAIVTKLEQSAEIVKDLVTRGPIALWERLKDFLVNLKDGLFSQIRDLVITQVVTSAVTKLASMLNPAGALVQLALTIYRVVKFFIEKWDTITAIVNGVLGTITKVALGSVGGAAKFVEGIFAKGVQLMIGFLASIFGLAGIAQKVKALIKRISKPVLKAIDGVVKWIAKQGRKLMTKIKGFFGKGDKGKDKAGSGKDGKYTEKDRKAGLAAFEKAEKPYVKDNKIGREDAGKVAKTVAGKHPVFKSISVVDGGDDWEYGYVMRANVVTPSKKPKQNFKARAAAIKKNAVKRKERKIKAKDPSKTVHNIAISALVVAVGVSESGKMYSTLNTGATGTFLNEVKAAISGKETFAGTYGGDLHAEENLTKGAVAMGDKIIHMDVSNPICLDCQRRVIEALNIITSTGFTGKRPRAREKREQQATIDKFQLSIFDLI